MEESSAHCSERSYKTKLGIRYEASKKYDSEVVVEVRYFLALAMAASAACDMRNVYLTQPQLLFWWKYSSAEFPPSDVNQMATESKERQEYTTRGTKRPPPWRRHKASRAAYEDGRVSNRRECYSNPERAQKEQVRLNQIQEDEKSREWVAQEDDFVLKQAKKRAEIRVKEGRAKAIDWLVVAMRVIDTTRNPLDDEFDPAQVDILDPSKVLEEVSEEQSFELEKDIDTFLHLEKSAQNKDYWRVS